MLAEELDPLLVAVSDFANDEVDATATDNAGGDSGICAVDLLDNTNLQLSGLSFTPGDGSVSFSVTLVNPLANGTAKLR
ncbi:MAG: hypothetical protein HC814_00515, partial [Rhodobacteraceae bacterium]|nr:hypothetical protein [Paracoccaceae bacterium]